MLGKVTEKMALTINTNLSSLIAQKNLKTSTNALNTAIERMTTGYKINNSKDNAAGYSIANMWSTQLSSLDVAADNAATGMDMLTTAEETYSLLSDHLQRIRDLTEQASNGTYGSASLKAIQSEVYSRFQEISRIANNAEFNGIKLMQFDKATGADNSKVGLTANGVNLQVGLYADVNSRINLSIDLFENATVSGLFNGLLTSPNSISGKSLTYILQKASNNAFTQGTLNQEAGLKTIAAACCGLNYVNDTTYYLQKDKDATAREMLTFLDLAISELTDRSTQIGAAQNRVESAITALDVQTQNMTSSLSTLRDADVAEESSNYIQAQILQQASATLLSTANQLPSIALSLI